MNLKECAENLGLEEDEYIEMLDLFFETGGADLKILEAAVAEGAAQQAHAASHALKGSAGSLGLIPIYEQCRIIDDKLRVNDLDGVAKMVVNLRREYDALASVVGRDL